MSLGPDTKPSAMALSMKSLLMDDVGSTRIEEFQQVLAFMGDSLFSLSKMAFERLALSSDADRLLVANCVRAILEVSGSVLLLKIDPFRILMIAKIQNRLDYDLCQRSSSSVQWTGDILVSKESKDIGPELPTSEFCRALLEKHFREIFWYPAFKALLDDSRDLSLPSSWLQDLVSQKEEVVMKAIISKLKKSYSYFSKFIHHEFLNETVFDRSTFIEKVEEVIEGIAKLALISNFFPYSRPTAMEDLVRKMVLIEDSFGILCELEQL